MDLNKFSAIDTKDKVSSVINLLLAEVNLMQYEAYRKNIKEKILSRCFSIQIKEHFCNLYDKAFASTENDLRDSVAKKLITISHNADYDKYLLSYDFEKCCVCAKLKYKEVELALMNYARRHCDDVSYNELMYYYVRTFFLNKKITVSIALFNRLCQLGTTFARQECRKAIYYSSDKANWKKNWKDEPKKHNKPFKWKRELEPPNEKLREMGEYGPKIIYTPFGGQNGKKRH